MPKHREIWYCCFCQCYRETDAEDFLCCGMDNSLYTGDEYWWDEFVEERDFRHRRNNG